jgi:hypothetical protein
MTDEQINQRIAEACGWTDIHDSGPWHNHTLWGYPPIKPGQGGNAYKYLLNYCTNLNAMHEAEKVLKGYDQIATYVWHLENRAGDWSTDLQLMATHATARQRAEAFLRTLGKWEEVQE